MPNRLIRKLKYNPRLFDKLLEESPKHDLPGEQWSMVLGNREPSKTITVVTNPYCQPCGEAHSILYKMMHKNKNIQVRFVLSPVIFDAPVSLHLMAIKEQCDESTLSNALHDWYMNKYKTYDEWAEVYPAQIQPKEYYVFDKLQNWIKVAKIKDSPAIMINGHHLPEGYMISDLKYMLA